MGLSIAVKVFTVVCTGESFLPLDICFFFMVFCSFFMQEDTLLKI